MLRFIAERLVSGAILLCAIATFTFFLIYSSGANIAQTILGQSASQEQVAAKAAELGLDQPLAERYISWLGAAAKGDLGNSWFTSEAVSSAILGRLPVTITLVVMALVISGLAATVLAMLAAVRRGWLDKVLQVFSVAGFAIPGFIVGILLITVFALNLKILPATGYVPFPRDPARWSMSITLPVAALAIASVAAVASQLRSSIIEVRQKDFVRTLKTRGLGQGEILFRHVLRSSASSGLTVLSLQFVGLMSGSVVIEQLFALPGIGSLAVNSTAQGDLPVVMGVVVYTVIVVIVVNVLVDLLVGFLNPKVRVH
ncbi:peptide/nickel transport system permease protein [Pseudarthrobacter sp. PvP004]|uniref:ABC transporter permease n=1 Tax=Pseudarthrobacter sp. PvP004 TaxID=2817850 RepID=UPI001AE1C811|nr:ABC transporter permease [Pseudarthrobacter sp. PvP004]MBP2266182.1 peptide/nickel transport system permease protein [Pseudarthrobacter sp. PvP004]